MSIQSKYAAKHLADIAEWQVKPSEKTFLQVKQKLIGYAQSMNAAILKENADYREAIDRENKKVNRAFAGAAAAMGCKEQTFGGLAGIGDLIVTATSMHSRNNRCGMLIGRGVTVEDAINQVGMVVEGLNALPAAVSLARKYNVEMPIVETVDAVVSGRVDVSAAIELLMARELKAEIGGTAFNNVYD